MRSAMILVALAACTSMHRDQGPFCVELDSTGSGSAVAEVTVFLDTCRSSSLDSLRAECEVEVDGAQAQVRSWDRFRRPLVGGINDDCNVITATCTAKVGRDLPISFAHGDRTITLEDAGNIACSDDLDTRDYVGF